jgi:hypothetical protein
MMTEASLNAAKNQRLLDVTEKETENASPDQQHEHRLAEDIDDDVHRRAMLRPCDLVGSSLRSLWIAVADERPLSHGSIVFVSRESVWRCLCATRR